MQFINQMGDDIPEKFYLAGYGNGAYQAGLYAAAFPGQIEKLLLLAPSHFCPEPQKKNNVYSSDTIVHVYQEVMGMTKPQLYELCEEKIKSSINSNLSSKETKAVVSYLSAILSHQDEGQIAFLKAFRPQG